LLASLMRSRLNVPVRLTVAAEGTGWSVESGCVADRPCCG